MPWSFFLSTWTNDFTSVNWEGRKRDSLQFHQLPPTVGMTENSRVCSQIVVSEERADILTPESFQNMCCLVRKHSCRK